MKLVLATFCLLATTLTSTAFAGATGVHCGSNPAGPNTFLDVSEFKPDLKVSLTDRDGDIVTLDADRPRPMMSIFINSTKQNVRVDGPTKGTARTVVIDSKEYTCIYSVAQ